MKATTLFCSAIAVLGMTAAHAQVTTTPVGYVSLGNTSGDAVPANTDQRISIPMLNATEFTGTVATGGVNPGNITVTGASFTTDQYAGYYCQITSGTNDGQFLLVTSNNADTLTVEAQPGDSLTGIADGDTLALSQAWTIGTFLGAQPVGTSLLTFDGTANGINIATSETFVYGDLGSGNVWFSTSTFQNSNNTILFPGEALVIRTGASPITELIVSGSVPVETNRNIIYGGAGAQDTPIAYTSPVDELISGLNFPAVPGDSILVFDSSTTGINKSSSTTYAYGDLGSGNVWFSTTTFQAVTTESIPAGSSFVYRRGGAASDTAWTDDASYIQP